MRDFEAVANEVYKKARGLKLDEYKAIEAASYQRSAAKGDGMAIFDAVRLAWAAGYDSGLRKGKRAAQNENHN